MLAWFQPVGFTYRPRTWQGAVATLIAIAAAVVAFVTVDRHSHSASDTLIGAGPWIALVALAWYLLAARSSSAGTLADDVELRRDDDPR